MKKKILIIGADGSGKQALLEALALSASNNMLFVEMPPAAAHGPPQTTLETLTAELDKLASESVKAKDVALELTRIAKHTESFKPKKVHPKHQKNNKYRFNK